jgi:hypothetical protein
MIGLETCCVLIEDAQGRAARRAEKGSRGASWGRLQPKRLPTIAVVVSQGPRGLVCPHRCTLPLSSAWATSAVLTARHPRTIVAPSKTLSRCRSPQTDRGKRTHSLH